MNASSICRCISLAMLILVAVVNLFWCRFVRFVVSLIHAKEKCPHFSKNDCPYGRKDECIYDTTGCRVFGNNKKSKQKALLWSLLVFSFCITVFFEIEKDNPEFVISLESLNWLKIYKILQPILNSFIAAIIVSLLIDIPSRMKEYQTYFVELLSSSDYLKKMTEAELTNLRKEVTWLLHVKDYPNMPKKLIDLDERFCEMLKMPYYKEYTQTINIEKESDDFLKKKVRIEYIAYNPQRKDNPIAMDISFSNSLRFENVVNAENAKELFKITKLMCAIDDFNQDMNLMPLIKIGVSNETRDGYAYNGRVHLMSQLGNSNKENPLSYYAIKTYKSAANTVNYEMSSEEQKPNLYLSFCDKIKVKIQYEVIVPDSDISYTKRLRYPAKYFHLDYKLADDVNYKVVGQLIGTQIDQPDVSIIVSDDKKNIKIQTHNWLLPKNGAVIVHCKD